MRSVCCLTTERRVTTVDAVKLGKVLNMREKILDKLLKQSQQQIKISVSFHYHDDTIILREEKTMCYILVYKNGDISITKVIEADSKEQAIDIFLEAYEDYDITRNEIDVMVHDDVKKFVNNFWETVNANR